MSNPIDNFVRIGVRYYKIVITYDRYNIKRESLLLWSKEALVDDFGKHVIAEIKKLDGFINEPNNINYSRIVNNKWNIYESTPYHMATARDYRKPTVTLDFLKHIFGDKIDIGLKYMKVIYEDPKQKLPILALVSKERQTGKSTFINYMDILYGDNTVILEPSRMSSQFNSSYVTKNIIAIEETEFQSKSMSEKIKALSTMNKVSVNTKGVQEYDVPFYGKIIFASNNEEKFSIVRDDEIRYFVLKVDHIKKLNIDILEDMAEEASSFLRYLKYEVTVEYKTRMVFTAEEITTDALTKVKEESKSNIAKDILTILDEVGGANPGEQELHFSATDLKNDYKLNASVYYISKVIKRELEIPRLEKPIRYVRLTALGLTNIKDRFNKPFVYINPNYDENYSKNVINMRPASNG